MIIVGKEIKEAWKQYILARLSKTKHTNDVKTIEYCHRELKAL